MTPHPPSASTHQTHARIYTHTQKFRHAQGHTTRARTRSHSPPLRTGAPRRAARSAAPSRVFCGGAHGRARQRLGAGTSAGGPGTETRGRHLSKTSDTVHSAGIISTSRAAGGVETRCRPSPTPPPPPPPPAAPPPPRMLIARREGVGGSVRGAPSDGPSTQPACHARARERSATTHGRVHARAPRCTHAPAPSGTRLFVPPRRAPNASEQTLSSLRPARVARDLT